MIWKSYVAMTGYNSQSKHTPLMPPWGHSSANQTKVSIMYLFSICMDKKDEMSI